MAKEVSMSINGPNLYSVEPWTGYVKSHEITRAQIKKILDKYKEYGARWSESDKNFRFTHDPRTVL